MNRQVRQQVSDIAWGVRSWAVARAGRDHDLAGWCARASGQLWRLLAQEGVRSEIHEWDSAWDHTAHVFVVVSDHVVDVTATQFGAFRRQPVVIMHHREAEIHAFYQTTRVWNSADQLRQHQIRAGWPRDQIAFDRVIHWPD